MSGWTRFIAAGIGLAALFGMTGCQDGRDKQIEQLQLDREKLAKDNADLDGQLRMAMNDAENARQRALQLQDQLEEARRRLGEGRGNLPEGWTGTENIAWIDLKEEVLFDSGRAELKPGARSALQKVVGDIQAKFPRHEIWVIGHTDTDPIKVTKDKWRDNLDLSANRAMNVTREFWTMGIERNRVVAAGQGEFNPRAANTSKAGKAQNRRVQIVAVLRPQVTPDSGSPAGGPPPGGDGGEQG